MKANGRSYRRSSLSWKIAPEGAQSPFCNMGRHHRVTDYAFRPLSVTLLKVK